MRVSAVLEQRTMAEGQITGRILSMNLAFGMRDSTAPLGSGFFHSLFDSPPF